MATNLQRFEMTIKSQLLLNMITPVEKEVYLSEQGLSQYTEYDNTPESLNKIEKACLQALEDIANNPDLMKDYKVDSEAYSNFHTNLRKRVDQLRKRVNSFSPNSGSGAGVFFFYK